MQTSYFIVEHLIVTLCVLVPTMFVLFYALNRMRHDARQAPSEGPETQRQVIQVMPDTRPIRRAYHLEVTAEQAEKLKVVLRYTAAVFVRLEFTEEEIKYICGCVRDFVTEGTVTPSADHPLTRHKGVTQTALKNFAWNIGNQYGLYGPPVALFVRETFYAWFQNTTLQTIEKTLKNSIGNHAVEIIEHLPEDKFE